MTITEEQPMKDSSRRKAVDNQPWKSSCRWTAAEDNHRRRTLEIQLQTNSCRRTNTEQLQKNKHICCRFHRLLLEMFLRCSSETCCLSSRQKINSFIYLFFVHVLLVESVPVQPLLFTFLIRDSFDQRRAFWFLFFLLVQVLALVQVLIWVCDLTPFLSLESSFGSQFSQVLFLYLV